MVDVCLNVLLVSLGVCDLRKHQTYGLVIDESQMLEHWRLGRKSRVSFISPGTSSVFAALLSVHQSMMIR